MNQYKYMFQYANIAYKRPDGSEPLFSDKVSFTPMDRGLDYCFIVEYPEKVIVAFRGTGTKEDGVHSIRTWLSDFDLYPLRGSIRCVEQGRDPHETLVQAGILKDGSWGKGTIHDGFYTTWQKFKNDMTSHMEKFKDKPIFCTGHSRGGALAELCARHLAKNMEMPCTLLEYGTPRVGTEEYAAQFRTYPVEATSIVNGYDLVTSLPPSKLGFKRAPDRIDMKQPWWHWFFHRIRDHYQENYIKALEKYYP